MAATVGFAIAFVVRTSIGLEGFDPGDGHTCTPIGRAQRARIQVLQGRRRLGDMKRVPEEGDNSRQLRSCSRVTATSEPSRSGCSRAHRGRRNFGFLSLGRAVSRTIANWNG